MKMDNTRKFPAICLAGALAFCSIQAKAFEDDIYYTEKPKKAKTATVKSTVADYPAADTYTVTTVGNVRDVDEYNRRGVFANSDSIPAQTYEQIAATYYYPDATDVDIYTDGGSVSTTGNININLYGGTAYPSAYVWGNPYYNSWVDPWYYPSWSFSFGSYWGPWGYSYWGPGYWGPTYWRPSYWRPSPPPPPRRPSPGRPGPAHRPGPGYAPGHGPGYRPASRPGSAVSPVRPGHRPGSGWGTSPARPGRPGGSASPGRPGSNPPATPARPGNSSPSTPSNSGSPARPGQNHSPSSPSYNSNSSHSRPGGYSSPSRGGGSRGGYSGGSRGGGSRGGGRH